MASLPTVDVVGILVVVVTVSFIFVVAVSLVVGDAVGDPVELTTTGVVVFVSVTVVSVTACDTVVSPKTQLDQPTNTAMKIAEINRNQCHEDSSQNISYPGTILSSTPRRYSYILYITIQINVSSSSSVYYLLCKHKNSISTAPGLGVVFPVTTGVLFVVTTSTVVSSTAGVVAAISLTQPWNSTLMVISLSGAERIG